MHYWEQLLKKTKCESSKILGSRPLREMLLGYPLILETLDTSSAACVIEQQIKLQRSIQHSTPAIDRVFRLALLLLMGRDLHVCCSTADGFRPTWWRTSLSAHTSACTASSSFCSFLITSGSRVNSYIHIDFLPDGCAKALAWLSCGSKVIPSYGSERGDPFVDE